jgi:predicted permease
MPAEFTTGAAPAQVRESWTMRISTGFAGDLRYAARRLWKERGFSAVALLTLALCIGANTAIFSVVYALVLRPLPFPAPNRILAIYNNFPKVGLNRFSSNLTQYSDFKAHTASFDAVGLYGTNMVMVGDDSSSERTMEAVCTAEMFDILGIKPIIGQFFTLKNCRPGEDKVIVLTESFWKSRYNRDPGVLDKPIRVDGETLRIIGVAPRSEEAFNAQPRFLRPISWDPASIHQQYPSHFPVYAYPRYAIHSPLYARLGPGVTLSRARAEVAGLQQHDYDASDSSTKDFKDRTGYRISVGLVQSERVQPIKSSLHLLQGGVALVLLIGCVNVANLLLARANGQQSELAIRAALGAGRGAIARLLLVESLLLTLAGALLGVGLAFGAVQAIDHFTERLLPNMLPIAIDGSVLGYTLGVSVAVGILIGLVPVAHILRSNLAEVIHRSSRSASGGRGVRALNGILVTGQIAVAFVLLSGAGLLIHSFANAISVNPGFDPRNLVVGSITLPSSYQDWNKSSALQRRLDQALREIPGVENAALATGVPFKGGLKVNPLSLKDSTLPRDLPKPGAFMVGVSLGYFQALRIQLLEGRFLDEMDTADGRHFVVDERFAQKYFPGRTAVGGHFIFGDPPDKEGDWFEIVGVVRKVPQNGVEDRSDNPFVYYPLLPTAPSGLSLFVRSPRPVGDIVSALRQKLRAIDPSIPLFDANTVQKVIDESYDNRRAVMLLLGGFAALALFLSAIGIYGVLAYDVSQRTREIGIRGAIGASHGQIVGMVMRQGLWKTCIGIGAGIFSAILLSRLMVSLLFELTPADPWAYSLVSLILAIVSVAACYLPARRAANVDPIEALRSE